MGFDPHHISQPMMQSQYRQRNTPSPFSAVQSGQTIFTSAARSGSLGAFEGSTLSVGTIETRLSQHWAQNGLVGRFQNSHVGQIFTRTVLFNPLYIAMTKSLPLQRKVLLQINGFSIIKPQNARKPFRFIIPSHTMHWN
jgi:hypothetical protein